MVASWGKKLNNMKTSNRFTVFRKRTLCEASAEAEPTLMYDIGSNCCCCLSPGSRSKIQCGVPFETMDVEDEKVRSY